MLTGETRFSGFDARSWHRLVTLVAPGWSSHPPYAHARRAAGDGGVLVVLHRDDKIVRAVHSLRGAVQVDAWPGAEGLEALAKEHGARFAMAAEVGALEELGERVGGRLAPGDDIWATALIVAGSIRELVDQGRVVLLPKFSAGVPLPPPEVLRKAWDHVLPEGNAAVLALFDDGELDSGVAVVRRGGHVDHVYGPEGIITMTGPLGGDFRRDYRIVRASVERELGPLAIGMYTTTHTLRELLRSEVPGAWARAIAARDIVVDPIPSWMSVAMGASVFRAAAAQSRSIRTGLELLGRITPFARRVRELSEVFGDFDLRHVLGFDPLDLLAGVLRRSSTAQRNDDDLHE